jgi:magnesium-transporting ATPase (P-type)
MTAPPGIYYNPNTPQTIVMVQQPPDYNYKPSSFLKMSILMTVLCGIFSPLMVFFTIPAIILGLKSQDAQKMGNMKVARNYGLWASYLNLSAMIVGFVVAILVTGLVIGLYSATFWDNYYHRN